jgi:hypothetical protein
MARRIVGRPSAYAKGKVDAARKFVADLEVNRQRAKEERERLYNHDGTPK